MRRTSDSHRAPFREELPRDAVKHTKMVFEYFRLLNRLDLGMDENVQCTWRIAMHHQVFDCSIEESKWSIERIR